MCVAPPLPTLRRRRATHTRRRRVTHTDLVHVQGLVDPQLSEPYSVFTYRYFLTAWPHLCFMVRPAPFRLSHDTLATRKGKHAVRQPWLVDSCDSQRLPLS